MSPDVFSPTSFAVRASKYIITTGKYIATIYDFNFYNILKIKMRKHVEGIWLQEIKECRKTVEGRTGLPGSYDDMIGKKIIFYNEEVGEVVAKLLKVNYYDDIIDYIESVGIKKCAPHLKDVESVYDAYVDVYSKLWKKNSKDKVDAAKKYVKSKGGICALYIKVVQVDVNDPDGKIFKYKITDVVDSYTVQDIEMNGSVDVYLGAHKSLRDELINNGFKISKIECIKESSKHTEVGDTPPMIFTTMLEELCLDMIIIGDSEEDFRCFHTFYFSKKYSNYEYNLWMGSVYYLKINEGDLYLFAHISDKNECKSIIDTLFPDLKVIYRKDSITINLRDLPR